MDQYESLSVITPWEWVLSLATSWALFGLIWTVQLVHYPSFRFVPDFTAFHAHHTSSITLVVGPLMLAEMAVSAWMVYRTGFSAAWLLPMIVVLIIWSVTVFSAVPLHESLATLRDDAVIESLIVANWPRTVLWTIKSLWVSVLFIQYTHPAWSR